MVVEENKLKYKGKKDYSTKQKLLGETQGQA